MPVYKGKVLVGRISEAGATTGQVVTYDGSVVTWGNASSSGTPILVSAATTYNVPDNTQVTFGQSITVDGFIQTDGYLVEVT